jgi:phage tail sheath protein FI
MVQIAGYPGIYIEEFAPQSPIEGVGTNTVGFIGTAAMGRTEPVRLFNWDAFEKEFGDWKAQYPDSYLAPAVYGFFLNGGTVCYVLRASTGTHATWELKHGTGQGATTVLLVEARAEGTAGNTIDFTVDQSSFLGDELARAGLATSTLPVHYAESQLTSPLPTGPNADRHTIAITPLVPPATPFRVGERVVLQSGAQPAISPIVVASVPNPGTVVLSENVPTNNTFQNFALRSADLEAGQREILIEVPAGIRLANVVPVGTVLQIGEGRQPAQQQSDIRVVQEAADGNAGSAITLAVGLRNRLTLSTAAKLEIASLEWDLNITAPVPEAFTFLSMQPAHPNYWGTKVVSTQVRLVEPDPPPRSASADLRPNRLTNPPQPASRGRDDNPRSAWLSLSTPSAALARFSAIEDIDIVCVPGQTEASAQQEIVKFAEDKRKFAILDAPRPGDAEQHVGRIRGTNDHAGHAALYHPWLLVRHPDSGQKVYWPPCGHVAGIYARTDQRGVHVAPANESVMGAIGLAERLTDVEQAPLNKAGVNVLRIFAGRPQAMVWGARTTTDPDRNKAWQYVSTRRLFLYLEKSIERALRPSIFAPNNPELWARLRRTISDFLVKTHQDGAFGGLTPKDSFYVRIDDALNPESERILGRLYIEIGVRPAYPAEFIVLRIGIWDGGSSVDESP